MVVIQDLVLMRLLGVEVAVQVIIIHHLLVKEDTEVLVEELEGVLVTLQVI